MILSFEPILISLIPNKHRTSGVSCAERRIHTAAVDGHRRMGQDLPSSEIQLTAPPHQLALFEMAEQFYEAHLVRVGSEKEQTTEPAVSQ